jgi:hypothetical protein
MKWLHLNKITLMVQRYKHTRRVPVFSQPVLVYFLWIKKIQEKNMDWQIGKTWPPPVLWNPLTPCNNHCLLKATTTPSFSGRKNVSASAFLCLYLCVPWKTAFQGYYFATFFPSQIFHWIYLITLFSCNWQKTH